MKTAVTVAIERVANTSCFHRDQGPELSDRSTSCSPMVLGHEMDGVVFERPSTGCEGRVVNDACRDVGIEVCPYRCPYTVNIQLKACF